jgi:peptide/nickel transport system ATP-binding protein
MSSGEIGRLFRNPLHPYTQGLLLSIPRMIRRQQSLERIPGAVPNLLSPPGGCRLHPRCPQAMDICREVKPIPVTAEPDHAVRCHLSLGR